MFDAQISPLQRANALILLYRICRERLKSRKRQALAVEDLSDGEIDTIRRAEPPAEAAQYDHELTTGRGAES